MNDALKARINSVTLKTMITSELIYVESFVSADKLA